MSKDSTFRRVMDGVNNRKPSEKERVDYAKLKDQTKKTTDRTNEQAKKDRKATESMNRREK